MLDLEGDDHPSKRSVVPPRPLTSLDRQEGLVVVLVFVIWLPAYLIWLRPAINGVVFQYIPGYPAMLHLLPILGVPFALAMAYRWLARAWGRDQ
jgi:hypothetical protein